MKPKAIRRVCSLAVIASMTGSSYFAAAEDIDLFVGSSSSTAATRPNVLVIIDNSANWSAANQHWPNNV
ncbi:MAG TPA: hypothetical protein VNT02_09315, partial [Burkholderiales bacterium]|nr:hypothetical protein [Burkholderiales bacterium]